MSHLGIILYYLIIYLIHIIKNRLYFKNNEKMISPWHDIPLKYIDNNNNKIYFNYINEIPKGFSISFILFIHCIYNIYKNILE